MNKKKVKITFFIAQLMQAIIFTNNFLKINIQFHEFFSDILSDDKFSEGDVQTLMAYGFPRDKCIEELRAQNGDVTQATAALFAKSIKVNKQLYYLRKKA